MNRKNRTTLCVLLLAFSSSHLVAQVATNETPTGQETSSLPELIDINFEGGSVENFLAEIRKLDSNARILCSTAASSVSLPSIVMKKVTVQMCLESLEAITQSEWSALRFDVNAYDPVNADEEESIIYLIDVSSPQRIEIESTVINANAALESFVLRNTDPPAKQLQETIQTGLETIFNEGTENTVTVKLHETTGLVFIKGPTERVAFVVEIINQLSQTRTQLRANNVVPGNVPPGN